MARKNFPVSRRTNTHEAFGFVRFLFIRGGGSKPPPYEFVR